MDLINKFKETFLSIVPIFLFVLLVNFTMVPLGFLLPRFLLGSLLLFVGLTLFMFGADAAMVPFGQRLGSAIVRRRKVWLLLVISFALGFIITFAEPDVHVLGEQAAKAGLPIPKLELVGFIALSIGVFLCLAFVRTLKKWKMKWVFIIGYAIIYLCALFADGQIHPIAFDSSGATTGPMTVPLILALGLGVSHTLSAGEDDGGFGFVGVASIGPIVIVMILGLFVNFGHASNLGMGELELGSLGSCLLSGFEETATAILPLVVIFLILEPIFIKGSYRYVTRTLFGFLYTFLGIMLFLAGVKYGYLDTGTFIGKQLIALGFGKWVVLIGFLIGMIIVFAEPSVAVLVKQVQEVSAGHIKPALVYAFLAVGVGLAVALSALRAITGLSIWVFVGPGFALSLILSLFTPQMFTGIAFDSGGVASGPLCSSFVLSLIIGVSIGSGTEPMSDAFGLVGLIAMMPIVSIQILGILVKFKERRRKK